MCECNDDGDEDREYEPSPCWACGVVGHHCVAYGPMTRMQDTMQFYAVEMAKQIWSADHVERLAARPTLGDIIRSGKLTRFEVAKNLWVDE